jgi:hypothetical protein
MKFGITKIEKKDWRYYLNFSNVLFVVLLILCFTFFAFYSNITQLLFWKNKIDVFKEDLWKIAMYFWNIDEWVSNMFLAWDDIIKSYLSWDNVLISKKQEIQDLLWYVDENKYYLSSLWFDNYDGFISLLSDLNEDWDEVSTLLWEKWEFNYLVILQNTNEKRPNWWFFGSFAFITVKDWRLKNLEIIDAYYPDYIAENTRLRAPERASAFLPDLQIWFIAWNKFGFSDIDGSNLKRLYEKMFNEDYDQKKLETIINPELADKLLHKYIKWVIFIRSDLIEYLIPSFTQKAREWQFQNANVDLIRWENRGNKKETYIQEVTKFFREHSLELFQDIINNFDEIVARNYINIYLSNVSDDLQNLLLNHWLKTVYDSWNIYAWDMNAAFNKVDSFVTKTTQIIDSSGTVVYETENDIIPVSDLSKGSYDLKICYTLNVPNFYINYMYDLAEKYWINMTDREEFILAIKPAQYENTPYPKRMETKWTVYLPLNYQVWEVSWSQQESKWFKAPFANWMYYRILINENNDTKCVKINFNNN